ncbi:hypothetical protein [uncultured Microscilla sp.]|uniref:toxin-antitoxin system YwqK family antitoxin n=1 Tax=uncultured Microscilla sp. TaxID=432653 RepID=UPI00260E4157|nr:hypothetical protein [uncultured Microscilla sp.]
MSKVYIVCMIVIIWSCQVRNSVTIPEVSVASTHKALKRQGGKWLYQNKPFSGTLVEHYTTGKVKSKSTYYQGEKHGVSKGWYAGGQRWFERGYAKGRKHGKQQIWWQNGQLKLTANAYNDMYEGSVKQWYFNGRLYRDFNYKKGKEEGHQRMWKTDGRIRANYVVKDGRQYGLTGVKNCKSVASK